MITFELFQIINPAFLYFFQPHGSANHREYISKVLAFTLNIVALYFRKRKNKEI